jgi:hypothetical protein
MEKSSVYRLHLHLINKQVVIRAAFSQGIHMRMFAKQQVIRRKGINKNRHYENRPEFLFWPGGLIPVFY